jgi:hypothetical protein
MERRKTIRFLLSLPVTFRWRIAGESEQQAEHQANGVSRDVSATGILVECVDECPPAHAEVQVVVTIQAQVSSVEIAATSEVTRTYASGDVQGFAATGTFEVLFPHLINPKEPLERAC